MMVSIAVVEVRSFRHLSSSGPISEAKRKSLPAGLAGLDNAQKSNCTIFSPGSPWRVEEFRQQRLQLILQILQILGEPEVARH